MLDIRVLGTFFAKGLESHDRTQQIREALEHEYTDGLIHFFVFAYEGGEFKALPYFALGDYSSKSEEALFGLGHEANADVLCWSLPDRANADWLFGYLSLWQKANLFYVEVYSENETPLAEEDR